MSEARWGTDKPTEPGAYWFRNQGGLQMLVVIYGSWNRLEVNCQGDTELANYNGEWLGPITPDVYAAGRMAGLQYCEQLAKEYGEARILAEMVAQTLKPEIHTCMASMSNGIALEIHKQIEAQGGEHGGK